MSRMVAGKLRMDVQSVPLAEVIEGGARNGRAERRRRDRFGCSRFSTPR